MAGSGFVQGNAKHGEPKLVVDGGDAIESAEPGGIVVAQGRPDVTGIRFFGLLGGPVDTHLSPKTEGVARVIEDVHGSGGKGDVGGDVAVLEDVTRERFIVGDGGIAVG